MDLDVYTSQVKEWAKKLRDKTQAEAQRLTKSNPHAIFVEYGAGKGYIRVNGKIVRGSRIDKKRNFKIGSGAIKRHPKPIISNPLEQSIDELREIAQIAAEKRIINSMVLKF